MHRRTSRFAQTLPLLHEDILASFRATIRARDLEEAEQAAAQVDRGIGRLIDVVGDGSNAWQEAYDVLAAAAEAEPRSVALIASQMALDLSQRGMP